MPVAYWVTPPSTTTLPGVLVHADRGDPAEAIRVLDLGAAPRMIVCQDTPNPRADPVTVDPLRTAVTPAAAARAVSSARGAIASCCSVQVLTSHSGCLQVQTRLTQHSTTTPSGDRRIGHPARAPVLRRRDRPTPRARHQIRRGLDHQLKLTAGVGPSEDLEPVQPEQLSRHRLGSIRDHLGPSSILVVSSW